MFYYRGYIHIKGKWSTIITIMLLSLYQSLTSIVTSSLLSTVIIFILNRRSFLHCLYIFIQSVRSFCSSSFTHIFPFVLSFCFFFQFFFLFFSSFKMTYKIILNRCDQKCWSEEHHFTI